MINTLSGYKMVTHITEAPEWMQKKIERLEFVVSILAAAGPREVKIYPEHKIMELKRYIAEAQDIYASLRNSNIIGIAGQNPAWVALDKMTLHEIEEKLDLIATLWDGGGDVTFTGKTDDVSKPLPTDDFSEEEDSTPRW